MARLSLMHCLQDLLAAAHGESSAAAAAADLAAACSSISQRGGRLGAGLQQLQQQACTGLRSSCAYLGCLLPGDVLSLAALLLSESCAWLLVCLEVSACAPAEQCCKSATTIGRHAPCLAPVASHIMSVVQHV